MVWSDRDLRKGVAVYLNEQDVAQLLKLPEGSIVRSINYDPMRMCLIILVLNKNFEPVPMNTEFPRVEWKFDFEPCDHEEYHISLNFDSIKKEEESTR